MERNGEKMALNYNVEQVDCKKITVEIEFPDPSDIDADDELIININEPHAFISEDGSGILNPGSVKDQGRQKLTR